MRYPYRPKVFIVLKRALFFFVLFIPFDKNIIKIPPETSTEIYLSVFIPIMSDFVPPF